MKYIVAIISTFAILLCFANAQAGGNDPDCCMGVCCVVNGQYKCSRTANSCFQGQKYASGPKCGAGNNGMICKKPTNDATLIRTKKDSEGKESKSIRYKSVFAKSDFENAIKNNKNPFY